MSTCLFCRFVRGEIKPAVVLETDDVLAFRDINPQAPVHVLVIPKRHISTLNDLTAADAELVGKLYLAAGEIARREGVAESGWRAVINCNGDAGQSVFHIHLHVLAGRALAWPPG